MLTLYKRVEKGRRPKLGTAENLREAQELALMFVTDPRDTIDTVYIYDNDAGQFRGWVKRPEAKRQRRAA